jgi:hypothetical protein
MADWRKVALAAFLSGGKLEDDHIKIIKKELWADGKITVNEVEFLIELRNAAQKKAKGEPLNTKFMKLFFEAIEANVLADGKISANEANWLRKMLLADGKIDDEEMSFLTRIRKKATKTAPEFEALYSEMKGKHDRAALKAAKKS